MSSVEVKPVRAARSAGPPTRQRTVRALIRAAAALASVFLLVTLVTIWRLRSNVEWAEVVPTFLPLLFLLGCGSYFLRSLRWFTLVRRVAPKLPYRVSLRIYMAGFALGLTPARAGEMLKFSMLRDVTGVEETHSAPIFAVERSTEAASFLTLAVAGAVLGQFRLSHLHAGAVAAVIALPILAATGPAVRLLRGRIRGRQGKGGHMWRQLLSGLSSIADPATVLRAMCCALAARVCDALLFWTASIAAGLHISLAGAAMAFGVAGLIGGLSMLPGGVGAVEASITATVVAVGGTVDGALAAALMARLMTLWIWVPIGLCYALSASQLLIPAEAVLQLRSRD